MEKSTNLYTTILSGQNVNVPAPKVGEALIIQSSPAGNLNILFDISSASPEREDNDLVLNTEGGIVVIAGFFEVGDESLPSLTLEDGTLVDATVFFEGSGLDLTTDAGEAKSAESSGTKYSDDAGGLLLGVDRLGVLDSEAANARGTESLGAGGLAGSDSSLPYGSSDTTLSSGPSGPSDPNYPSEPEEEILPPIDYDMRAILYSPSGSSDNELHLNVRYAFKNPDPSYSGSEVTVEHAEYAKGYFTFDPDNLFDSMGDLVLTLSEEGKSKLQSSGGASIYDYITVNIDGEEHTIQLVANGNGRFETGFEHPSGKLAESGLAHGEWNQGKDIGEDFNGQDINTSDLADDLDFTGNITNANISTNDGDDTFELRGNLSDSVLDLAAGNDWAYIHGAVTSSEIHIGQGDNEYFRVIGNVSDSLITSGSGITNITLSGDVSGSKILGYEGGKENLTINGALKNSQLSLGDGDDRFIMSGDITESSIDMGDGDDRFSLSGNVTGSSIDMGAGNDSLNISKGVTDSYLNMGNGSDTVELLENVTSSEIHLGQGDHDSLKVVGSVSDSLISGSSGVNDLLLGDVNNSQIHLENSKNTVEFGALGENSVITLAGGETQITANGGISDSKVLTNGDGKESLSVKGSLKNSELSLGDGDDSFIMSGNVTGSSIDMGNGDDNLNISTGMTGSFIDMGAGSDAVEILGTLSSSEIHLGQGDKDDLKLTGSMRDSLITGGSGANNIFLGASVNNSKIHLEDSINRIDVSGQLKGSELTFVGGDTKVFVNNVYDSKFLGFEDGAENLQINGSLNNSYIDLGAGKDYISVVYGVTGSSIYMGDGVDRLSIGETATKSSFFMGDGDDTFGVSMMLDSSLDMGTGNDYVALYGSVTNSSINLGDGNDTLLTSNGGLEKSSLDLGDGNDLVQFSYASDSTVKSGAGKSQITIAKDLYRSLIEGKEGDDTVFIGGNMKGATLGGDSKGSTISLGGGQNHVKISGTMLADTNIKNTISADSSGIYLGKGMKAFWNGENIINTGAEAVNAAGQSFIIKSETLGMEASGVRASNIIIGGDYKASSESSGFSIKVSSLNSPPPANPIGLRGMKAVDGGLNSISLRDTNIEIEVLNKYGTASALYAENGTNRIESGGDLITRVETTGAFDTYSLSAKGGLNAIDVAGDVNLIVNNNKSGASIPSDSSHKVSGLFSDNGQNIITAGGNIDIAVNSKYGPNVSGIHSLNGSSDGFSAELKSGGNIKITATRDYLSTASDAETAVLKGVSAEGARNSLSAEGSIEIDLINKVANSGESYGVQATASGENHFHGDTRISSTLEKVATGTASDLQSYGVSAEGSGKNIFNGDLDIKSQASGSYYYSNAESYGLYAGSQGHNIVHGGLTVLSSSSGTYGKSYGVLAENHGINQVGELDNLDNLAQGNISINAHGPRVDRNSGKEGQSIGVEASDHGQNLFYTTGNVSIKAGSETLGTGLVDNTIGLHAKDNGLNHIYTDGGNIEIEALGKGYVENLSASTVRADNGINILETTSGNISLKAWHDYRAHALEAINNGENHIITQTGDIHLWGQAGIIPTEDSALVYAENGGVNYIGNVHHDAEGNPLDQQLGTGNGITVTIEPTYTSISNGYSLEARDGGTNVIRTNAGDDTIRLLGSVNAMGSGKNIIDAGAGHNTIEIDGFVRNTEITTGSGDDRIDIKGNIFDSSIDAGTGHNIINGLIFSNKELGSHHSILSEYGKINIQHMSSSFVQNAGLELSGDLRSTIETTGADVNISGVAGQGTAMIAASSTYDPKAEHIVNAHNLIKSDSGNVSLAVNDTQQGWTMVAGLNSTNTIETNSGDVSLSSVTRLDGTSGSNMAIYQSYNYKGSTALNKISTKTGDITLEAKSNGYVYNMRGDGSGTNLIETEDGSIRLDAIGQYYSDTYNMYSNNYGKNKIVSKGSGDIELNAYKVDPTYDDGRIKASNAYGLCAFGDSSNVIESKAGDVRINTGFALDKAYEADSVLSSVGMNTHVWVKDNEHIKEGEIGFVPKDSQALNRISSDSGDIYITAKGSYEAIGMSASRYSGDMDKESTSTNIIETNSGDINVSALTNESTNVNSVASGMFAAYGGKNIIRSIDYENNLNGISITIIAQGNKLSKAMQAEFYGENHIISGQGNDTITLTGDVYATYGGVNRIETHGGDDTLIINGDVEAAYSLKETSPSTKTIIDLGDGNNTLIINGNLHSIGDFSETWVSMGSGHDTVKISGDIGIVLAFNTKFYMDLGDGNNILTVEGGIRVLGNSGFYFEIKSGSGDDIITVAEVENSGRMFIDTGAGNDSFTVNGDFFTSYGSLSQVLTGVGNDNVHLKGDLYTETRPDYASEIKASSKTLIDTGDGDDFIQIDGAMRAGQNSTNEILSGAGDDTVIINGGLYGAVASANSVATNIIDTGSGNDIVTINGGVFGTLNSNHIIRLGDGHDTLTINGDIELHAVSDGHYKGKLEIGAGDGDDIIIFNGKVIGSGTLTVDGGTGNDQLVLQAANLNEFIERYGEWLKQPGLIQNIESIKLDGLSDAEKVQLQAGGFFNNLGGVTIYTDEGLLTAAAKMESFSVLAGLAIDSDDSILTDATDMENFSAKAGMNYSGEFSEEVSELTGMVFKDGDDRLVFNNKLSNSILSMGEGDDLILVNSNMESIKLNMGEGNDSLYINHAVLDSQINMGSGEDHLYINSDFFNSDSSSRVGSSFDGGEGDDTLHLHGSGDIKLSELADLFEGFETIDLSGGGKSVLDIDSLISKSEKNLMIKGDEGQDKVSLSESWISTEETQVHDEISYAVYSHVEDDTSLILIQLGLIG